MAVDDRAILPLVAVVNAPVGIKVNCPPLLTMLAGTVIVVICTAPEINVILFVGAIVVALAIVDAAALVDTIDCTELVTLAKVAYVLRVDANPVALT
jgi:hypothetical protein